MASINLNSFLHEFPEEVNVSINDPRIVRETQPRYDEIINILFSEKTPSRHALILEILGRSPA